jgi:hypothetical protein
VQDDPSSDDGVLSPEHADDDQEVQVQAPQSHKQSRRAADRRAEVRTCQYIFILLVG